MILRSIRSVYEAGMHRVLARVDARLAEDPDLEALAAVASFYRFHRRFAAWMGERLGEYLRRRRAEIGAGRLAAQPAPSVLDVAVSVGFGSAESFTLAFKAHFGRAASAWRRGASGRAADRDSGQAKSHSGQVGGRIRVPVAPLQTVTSAGQALAFMSARGLDKVSAFTIEATSRLPDVVGRSAAGCYLQSHDRAYVLTYAQFRRRQTWFGVPVSRALYRSLVTHESAHAIAACNFNVAAPSIQAREYIAYVAMFSTMPAGLRTRALAALPGSGFDELDHVNSIVYLFDPMRFGAESYRHFVAQPDGAAVLRDVLDGRALAE